MIDAILIYQKDPSSKSKWHLAKAVGEIPMFQPKIYVSNYSANINARPGRRSDLGISARFNGKCQAISSIYSSPEKPLLGYGDIQGTQNLLLFRFNGTRTHLQVFLIEGRKVVSDVLFSRFLEGDLDEEMSGLLEAKGI